MNCPNCKAANADDARFCGSCGQTLAATESSNPKMTPFGEAPSLIGREIAGRYRVETKLGEGGMGAVYKAQQISLKRTVAVKLLRPEVAGSQMLLRRFNAEAEAVAKLSHPNTVNIYDFGQDSDGTLFIAMEYIEGKSLRDVVQQEAPLPLRRALAIAAQVAASLTDAHAHQIVHRDLKPDNVMLQGRGRQKDVVRVLDFGIAKLRDENRQSQMAMTQAGDMLGTPQYMSPEQIRGEHVDGRTDIYSLGGLLYEMVTGRLPFEAPTVMALLSKHLTETIVPPSQRRPDLGIPPAIDALITHAMAKDPAARPAMMEQFGEELNALLAMFPPESGQATAQQTAQTRSGGIPTPPAAYAAHPPIGPALAPPPASYQPPIGGAAPYNPHAGAPHPAPVPPASSGGKGIFVLLGLLVVAGIGIGVYFGVVKNGDKTTEPATGSAGSSVAAATPDAAIASPVAIDAAAVKSVDDPWETSGGTTIVPATGDDGDDGSDVEVEEPTPTPRPPTGGQKTTRGMPPECEEYAGAIEAMGKCSAIPKASRDAMLKAVKDMRKAYGSIDMTSDMRKQVGQACTQGAQGIKQSMAGLGCGS
ncbi:hypothetical protein BH11MYX3_BH11MYX3_35990 [soil metagenome]